MITIRAALPSDAERIAEIKNALIRDTTVTFRPDDVTLDSTVHDIQSAEAFLVAETAGTILGFASFDPFRAGQGYARVKEHSICLDQRHRGRGTGSLLLSNLVDLAQEQGVKYLIAGVSGENRKGIRFHTKHGFKQVGCLPGIGHKFGRPIDLIFMQKSL